MAVAADGFDWDAGNREKCRKARHFHCRNRSRSCSAILASAPDLKHAAREERLMAIGRNSRGRPMFVVFTFRHLDGKRLMRPLSARYMHKKEIDGYEAEGS